ncbi:hypothetical protein EG328_008586 [Venturia inaequalis]|uniref:Uncharacterized protein n=1 Tax=Venturia inaequalis TaxID=5025 RepID=A0A8H3VPW5_VENIN|nr:hypothetical protein EG328_008586 [Venturia inaequalis]KAE9991806.1 hypothetical protein EG327_010907 [Venturia inaequalis]
MAESPISILRTNDGASFSNGTLTRNSDQKLHQPEASPLKSISPVEQGLRTLTFDPLVTPALEPHSVLLRSAHLLKSIFYIFRCYTSFGAVKKIKYGSDGLTFSRSDLHEITEAGKFIWADQPFGSFVFDGGDGEKKI